MWLSACRAYGVNILFSIFAISYVAAAEPTIDTPAFGRSDTPSLYIFADP